MESPNAQAEWDREQNRAAIRALDPFARKHHKDAAIAYLIDYCELLEEELRNA